MALLFVSLSLLGAILMLLFIKAEVDIIYERGALISINISVFELLLYSNPKSKSNRKGRSERGKKTKRTALARLLFDLLSRSRVQINRIIIPSYFSGLQIPTYQYESTVFALIALLLAYLDTKTEKLYQSRGVYEIFSESESLVLEISASMRLISVLLVALKALREKVRRNYVGN